MASLPFCSKKNNKRSSVFPKFISCVLIFHAPNSIAFNIKRNIIIKWLSNELAISKFQSINSIWFTLIGSMQLFGSQRYRKHYRIATKISEIWLATRTSIFTYLCKERNMTILRCSANMRKITFESQRVNLRQCLCWLWNRNSLYWNASKDLN